MRCFTSLKNVLNHSHCPYIWNKQLRVNCYTTEGQLGNRCFPLYRERKDRCKNKTEWQLCWVMWRKRHLFDLMVEGDACIILERVLRWSVLCEKAFVSDMLTYWVDIQPQERWKKALGWGYRDKDRGPGEMAQLIKPLPQKYQGWHDQNPHQSWAGTVAVFNSIAWETDQRILHLYTCLHTHICPHCEHIYTNMYTDTYREVMKYNIERTDIFLSTFWRQTES